MAKVIVTEFTGALIENGVLTPVPIMPPLEETEVDTAGTDEITLSSGTRLVRMFTATDAVRAVFGGASATLTVDAASMPLASNVPNDVAIRGEASVLKIKFAVVALT